MPAPYETPERFNGLMLTATEGEGQIIIKCEKREAVMGRAAEDSYECSPSRTCRTLLSQLLYFIWIEMIHCKRFGLQEDKSCACGTGLDDSILKHM